VVGRERAVVEAPTPTENTALADRIGRSDDRVEHPTSEHHHTTRWADQRPPRAVELDLNAHRAGVAGGDADRARVRRAEHQLHRGSFRHEYLLSDAAPIISYV
jgi:hypothetical protein